MKITFRLILISSILCFSITNLRAQDSLAIAEEMYSMGMELFAFETRKQAKDMFVQATEFNPGHAKAQLMAGKAILLTVHKEEALSFLQTAYKLNPEIDEEILYLIGEAHQYSEEFDQAISYFKVYRQQLARSLSFDRSSKIYGLDWKIFECRNAKIYLANPVDVDIINLSENINSEYPDYAPLISADEKKMIFTSRRPHETNANTADDFENYEDIYESDFENGQWQPATPFPSPINGDFHNSNIGLSPDGTVLYIYTDENGGDILESDFINGKWTTPKPIKGLVNTPYLENSVTITADNKTIYFTSDKPGGYGGTDIYISHKDDKGRWGKPKNLGSTINTERDEEAPFISKSGEHLYFSSNGHAGMGDLDIYRATRTENDETFAEPVNMGYPINSVENDVFFVLSGDEKDAYYSSVKSTSKGEQDIYKLIMNRWQPINIDSLRKVVVNEILPFTQPNSTTVIPVAPVSEKYEANILLILTIIDAISLDTLEATVAMINHKDQSVIGGARNQHGDYEINFTNQDYEKYNVKINKDDYLPYDSKIHVIGHGNQDHTILETVALFPLKESFRGIMNVFFVIDSDKPNSYDDLLYLEYLMKDNPNIKVEISGHTDNTGSVVYNKDLSQRRADTIKNYLIEHDIDAARIKSVGYGLEKPIGDNNTRIGRRLNRRTEFIIIEH